MTTLHDFSANTLGGKPLSLATLKGKVALVVNTASECGLTPHYAGLESLHKKYAGKGLAVLGFPCNQFGAQEPGTAAEIGAFCQKNYGVSFQMFDKIEVNGKGAHPIWAYLKKEAPGFPWFRDIGWNFTKFLVDREGRVVSRFAQQIEPEELVPHIEKLL